MATSIHSGGVLGGNDFNVKSVIGSVKTVVGSDVMVVGLVTRGVEMGGAVSIVRFVIGAEVAVKLEDGEQAVVKVINATAKPTIAISTSSRNSIKTVWTDSLV